MAAALNWHGSPATFDDLLGLLCRLRNVERKFEVSLDGKDDGDRAIVETLVDTGTDVECEVLTAMQTEEFMKRLWAELRELQLHQLAAICLNFGPEELTALGTAVGWNELASSMALSLGTLASLVTKVPLPDRVIASFAGREPGQIPSIRKKAFQRLGRRLKKSPSEWLDT